MYEGKPLALVVGNTDTGRTPMAAALLRRALGPHVIVQTAGVLSHAGEGATPEAQMAIEQIGLTFTYKNKPKVEDIFTEQYLPAAELRKIP